MVNPSTGASPGLMAALKNIAGHVLTMVQTRLALLANEAQIQKQQLLTQLWLLVALLVCLVLAALLLVGLAVLLWWEQRIFVLGFFALLFSSLSVYLIITMRRGSAQQPPLFDQSLAALQEDLRQLQQATGHEPSSG